MTREEWLNNAVKALHPLFDEVGETVPPVKVSVGWPGGGNRKTRVGECWKSVASSDGVPQVFISPLKHEPADVLGILVHELVHAVDDCENGHRGRFAKIARAVGLTGKMSATVASESLANRLEGVASGLGKYPHSALTPQEKEKTQTTRMLKLECPNDGYIVRTTKKWLEVGHPSCPCGTEMEEAA